MVLTDNSFKQSALEYHRSLPHGKVALEITKPVNTQSDLARAYSPGVSYACEAIVENPMEVYELTNRGNLVAVITNGTAVLGLGAIGPEAAKPVMEGKAVLFKKFAGIDAFDLEIRELDPDKLVDIIASLEPSFGGINLEDIKAPECFYIEAALRKRMKIPVFHDDQHGTSIIVAAAVKNWLRLTERNITDIKLVTSGAGAAAIACLDLLVDMGLPLENITATDVNGVLYTGRPHTMDPKQARYAKDTNARTLDDAMEGADVFLGLSAPNVLKPETVTKMTAKPLVMALANPNPEILPERVREVRSDAIIATGRSDYPNQVNNVLCFPFIFRGALDVGANTINEAMKLACVDAIADLTMAEQSDVVTAVYGVDSDHSFGANNLIPKPFDPRLIVRIAMATAKAAMDSGVATRPITDWKAYEQRLTQYVFKTGLVMKPIFEQAQRAPKRIVFAEGENPSVLQAAQIAVDDGIAFPILIGRPEVIDVRIRRLGLRIRDKQDVEIINQEADSRFTDYWKTYHSIMERRGVSPTLAQAILRSNPTLIGALLVKKGDADGLICGTVGSYQQHFKDVVDIFGLVSGVQKASALNVLVVPRGTYFFADTHITPEPDGRDLAETAILAAERVRRFGMVPKIALLSHSSFGTHEDCIAERMRTALCEIRRLAPDIEVEGEMTAEAALSEEYRKTIFPNARLNGEANLFIMPGLSSANISFGLSKSMTEGQSIGPLLMGVNGTAHILTPATPVRGILNATAVACIDAQKVQHDAMLREAVQDIRKVAG